MSQIKLVISLLLLLQIISCTSSNKKGNFNMVDLKIKKFAKTEIKYDENLLDANQKKVLQKLYKASKLIDELFLEQVYSNNLSIKKKLENSNNKTDKKVLEYFNMMAGPFDRLDDDKPFYGKAEKPAGANFYPADMTKEEFNSWIAAHPNDKQNFTSEYTVIKRIDGKLIAVPYPEEYKEKCEAISKLLLEAADYADNASLKKYLTSRSAAFLSNDYYQSDMDWMDLKDHTIEVIIGPYEVYEDGLFNFKASYESFVTIVDPIESAKLKKFASYLTDIEKNLPIEDKYKNYNRGNESPIVVVQEVFSAGDTKAGVQTLAFNLPNDERVRKAKGSKKVMLKNIHEAKFEKLLLPIAEKVMNKHQLKYVTFDGFFNHTLMHEMSHGVGPGFIKVNGRDTEVKKELKETYSTIEECKADVLGMTNNIFMIKKGVYPPEFEKELWATFLAGIFRSIRFGINEAHGGGSAIIYNWMIKNDGYSYDSKTEKVKVNFNNVFEAINSLATKLLTIQAEGNYEGAQSLIDQYAVESESMRVLTKKLEDMPVDIYPEFQIEKE